MLCGKRANRAELRLLSLESLLARLALGWYLGTWIWGGVSPLPELKGSSLCLNYLYKQYGLCEHLPSFWEFGVLACARQRVLM